MTLHSIDGPTADTSSSSAATSAITEEQQKLSKDALIAQENALSDAEDALFAKLHHFLTLVQMQTPPIEKPVVLSNPPTTQEIAWAEKQKHAHLEAVAEWEMVHPDKKQAMKVTAKVKNILTPAAKIESPLPKPVTPYIYHGQTDPTIRGSADVPAGAHIRSWWVTNVTTSFADEKGRPDLRWLKERHLAVLRNTNLLVGANLTGFNLSGLDLVDINLSGANLSRAVMRDVNLTGARIDHTVMHDTNLTGAYNISNSSCIGGNELREFLQQHQVLLNHGTVLQSEEKEPERLPSSAKIVIANYSPDPATIDPDPINYVLVEKSPVMSPKHTSKIRRRSDPAVLDHHIR